MYYWKIINGKPSNAKCVDKYQKDFNIVTTANPKKTPHRTQLQNKQTKNQNHIESNGYKSLELNKFSDFDEPNKIIITLLLPFEVNPNNILQCSNSNSEYLCNA